MALVTVQRSPSVSSSPQSSVSIFVVPSVHAREWSGACTDAVGAVSLVLPSAVSVAALATGALGSEPTGLSALFGGALTAERKKGNRWRKRETEGISSYLSTFARQRGAADPRLPARKARRNKEHR
ncbi:hypothetical protein X777_15548 [Ooceraea biroi]|uniref:Uncharacterized protein n=1 Tax=Ooceraea biroi TaxID=2015173 RepID=A0A026VV51_OOCBI|nr:hypothetical protein X777_15548 [Ooceraea biroi]